MLVVSTIFKILLSGINTVVYEQAEVNTIKKEHVVPTTGNERE